MNDAGDLSASDSADYWGVYGLKTVINDNNAIYVQDDTPNNETQYRARFYVNPNSLTMATGDVLYLLIGDNAAGTSVLSVRMEKTATSYQIAAGMMNDAGGWAYTAGYNISNTWTAVEIHYQAFTTSGSLTLWIDDVQKQSLTFIDNDISSPLRGRAQSPMSASARKASRPAHGARSTSTTSNRADSRISALSPTPAWTIRKPPINPAGSRGRTTTAPASLTR